MADGEERKRKSQMLTLRRRYAELTAANYVQQRDTPALMVRKQRIEREYASYRAAHTEAVVRAADDDVLNALADEQEEIDQLYFEMMTILDTAVEQRAPAKDVTRADVSLLNQTGVIRVETARAPEPGEFDGKATSWPAFRDQFRAEVHDREQLDEVTKLLYLQKACMGAAKQALGDWQPIAINYIKAWESLEQKYDDPYRLEQALVSNLLRISRAKEETHETLRRIIDTSSNTMRQLEAMQVPVAQWDAIIIGILLYRLPRVTADAWEQRRDVTKKPSLKDLWAFLEGRARGRAYTEMDGRHEPNRHRAFDQNRGRLHENKRIRAYDTGGEWTSSDNNEMSNKTVTNGKKPVPPMLPIYKCKQCTAAHPLYKCPAFIAKSVEERAKNVQDWKLCANCLREHAGDCTWSSCRRCTGQMHNSMLCPRFEHKKTSASNQFIVRQQNNVDKRAYPYGRN